ncbi:MAG: hypothetical protein BAJALOKI3v1_10045 [Promethearchaeota archaeon]|nr:MAG: hypothetical protein BAJALOKI3v1_10045 [Candidatus Lokiarchaeota archaeon]
MRLFSPPKKDPSELLLYIWKIINLDNVSEQDLLYNISFELYLMSPDKTYIFIQKCVEKNLLIRNSDETLSLNENLEKKLQNWQEKRKNQMKKWEMQSKTQKSTLKQLKQEKKSDFNVLLKAFLDKGTLNRAVTVSDSAFNINVLDEASGVIEAEVQGSKEQPYKITLNTNKKNLNHDCDDFINKRARNKKFCKHLAKLFLLLKENNESLALKLLNNLASSINDWEFSS